MNGVPPALRAVKEENLAMTVRYNPGGIGRLGVHARDLLQRRQG